MMFHLTFQEWWALHWVMFGVLVWQLATVKAEVADLRRHFGVPARKRRFWRKD